MPKVNIKLSKTLIASLIGLSSLGGGLVTLHQTIDYINKEIVYPAFEPYIIATVETYLKEHPQEAVGLFDVLNDVFDIEKAAFTKTTKETHLILWHGMRDTTMYGYELRHQDGVYYTFNEGIVTEATYRRSARKFFYISAYGQEMEAPLIPEL